MKSQQANSHKILVVDDEGLIRWSLKEGLAARGYDVLEADNGRGALDKLGSGVDLVLVDYRLPDIDGLQVAMEVGQSRPFCPVILMTAYGSPELRRQAVDGNVLEVVDKPFDLDEMVALVGRTLEAAGSQSVGPASQR